MQYFIMFGLCVVAAITDVVTGLFKAHATDGYDSTVMRKGLYSKAVNLVVMLFFIVVDIGLDKLGEYCKQESLANLVGLISDAFAFVIIMLMESISIAENFAEANPKSTLAKVLSKRLKKIGKQIEKESAENGEK